MKIRDTYETSDRFTQVIRKHSNYPPKDEAATAYLRGKEKPAEQAHMHCERNKSRPIPIKGIYIAGEGWCLPLMSGRWNQKIAKTACCCHPWGCSSMRRNSKDSFKTSPAGYGSTYSHRQSDTLSNVKPENSRCRPAGYKRIGFVQDVAGRGSYGYRLLRGWIRDSKKQNGAAKRAEASDGIEKI